MHTAGPAPPWPGRGTAVDDLTPEEAKAIRALRKLAKTWPRTLWLFSGSGSLHVMRVGPDGEHVIVPGRRHGAVDPDYSVAIIDIPNDGGDW